MPANHLLSFYGSKDPLDGYAERQQHLHWSAGQYGNIHYQHPWNFEQLKETDFYQHHKDILDRERGAGFWLWKPYLLLQILGEIPKGDFLFYHDVGRAFRTDPHIGYQFHRPITPLVDWTRKHNGIFPGVYVPMYGRSAKWIKRDCFVLMDCDSETYWEQPQVQAGINVWQNTDRVREFVSEWLHYCRDARILTDDDNQCGEPNFGDFKDHRHDQAILTNLLRKRSISIYGDPATDTFKPREVSYITARVAADKLAAQNKVDDQVDLIELAAKRNDRRSERGTLPLYRMLMEERREEPLSILEISATQNDEVSLWQEYLADVSVHALYPGAPESIAADTEISETDNGQKTKNKITTHSVDPSHRPSMEIFAMRMKNLGISFDYIIEYGSGLMRDQQLAVATMFECLKPGGFFIIEQLEYAVRPGQGDLNANLSNSTLQLIKRINLHKYKINSHFFTLAEARRMEKLIQTAGSDWKKGNRYGIGMIRRFDDNDPERNPDRPNTPPEQST